MGAKRIRQLVIGCALLALSGLMAGSPAYGKGCANNVPSDASSSVSQYIEQLPTSCGNHATGTGKGSVKLPPSIQKKLETQGGSNAALLQRIATSESAGAPQQKIRVGNRHNRHNRILSDAARKTSNPLSASIGVVTDGSDSRLLALVILMVGVAAVVLTAAIRRRRLTD
jgi:hypothetical protein